VTEVTHTSICLRSYWMLRNVGWSLSYRRFGIIYRLHIQGSSSPMRKLRCDRRLKSHTYILRLKIISFCWIKRDQLDVTCFIISLFNAQHVSDVNTSILRNLRLICWAISWVVLLWFDVCWCYVVVWLGWCGIRMQAEALVPQPACGYQSNTTQEMLIHPHPYHTATAKPQHNTNTYRTRAI